jgi:enamidase
MDCKAIINIGELVSGDINIPIIDADTIVIKDGKIEAIGEYRITEDYQITEWIDCQGATVAPGLIDSHAHPVIGDYTPRQTSLNFLEGMVHGGVTSIISAGEVHTPGRPTDPAGVKALAVLAHKAFSNYRPNGLKVHGGALILEKGLVEDDIKEVSEQGVWLVGEVGLGSIKEPEDAIPLVKWAKKYGMKVAMHTGGTSIPGSSVVTAQMVLDVDPTLSSHTNGGPTSVSVKEVDKLIEDSTIPLEIVQCGNMKIADYIIRRLKGREELHRLVIGSDAPSGSGVIPLAILRTIAQLSSLSETPAAEVIACATGNTAKLFNLQTSIIQVGKEADLIIMDQPIGSSGNSALEALEIGDIPGIGFVMIDGEIQVTKSRNTPPPRRMPVMKPIVNQLN